MKSCLLHFKNRKSYPHLPISLQRNTFSYFKVHSPQRVWYGFSSAPLPNLLSSRTSLYPLSHSHFTYLHLPPHLNTNLKSLLSFHLLFLLPVAPPAQLSKSVFFLFVCSWIGHLERGLDCEGIILAHFTFVSILCGGSICMPVCISVVREEG